MSTVPDLRSGVIGSGLPGSRESLALLLEASAAINSSLDLQTTLQAIARTAADVLQAEAASVLLLDARRRKLVFKAAIGDAGTALIGREFDADLGIAGRVVSTGRPEQVRDARRDPAFYGAFDKQSSFTTRGMLAAPLRHREQVIGVVEVLNRRAGLPDFADGDMELLQIFANLAAIGVSNAQMHQELIRENRGLVESARADDNIIGAGPALRAAMELCERVAPARSSVLLLGETGTGKEMHARWIHQHSPRRERPFIGVNCAALPETLLESELFGHEAGAFTGASGRKQGRFELADGGTLFLDEIGDVGLSTQIKLLRVLQEREFVRVGGTRTIACDVRIIAATNRDLQRAISLGQFREDLYYRLNVFPITLPALRDRREDIAALCEHFAEIAARQIGTGPVRIAADALAALTAYRWPGNIRELRNVIERGVLLADQGRLTVAQLPPEVRSPQKPAVPSAARSNGAAAGAGRGLPAGDAGTGAAPSPVEMGDGSDFGGGGVDRAVADLERSMILGALRQCAWNQTRAAAALNMTRDNLRYRLRKYGIRRPGAEGD
ncbi:MAG: sigma 54-interacting transcriptional regulator [Phycisphaerales bacterium]|nr:sigma 54-interacting transcriptional regulator [Phycisphaerales bacterium]